MHPNVRNHVQEDKPAAFGVIESTMFALEGEGLTWEPCHIQVNRRCSELVAGSGIVEDPVSGGEVG